MENREIKIMVGSTVYGFEDQLSAIVSLLMTMGYTVINSHTGQMKVNPKLSNLENCLKAVEECDFFIGIIRPYYGTGNIGDKNITFEEIKHAIELNKPYWFLAHRDVVFARKLLNKLKAKNGGQWEDVAMIEKNTFFDPRCIDVYNYVIKEGVPVELRNGNWIQEFHRLDEVLTYIENQFSDKQFIIDILRQKEA